MGARWGVVQLRRWGLGGGHDKGMRVHVHAAAGVACRCSVPSMHAWRDLVHVGWMQCMHALLMVESSTTTAWHPAAAAALGSLGSHLTREVCTENAPGSEALFGACSLARFTISVCSICSLSCDLSTELGYIDTNFSSRWVWGRERGKVTDSAAKGRAWGRGEKEGRWIVYHRSIHHRGSPGRSRLLRPSLQSIQCQVGGQGLFRGVWLVEREGREWVGGGQRVHW
jgi:hypothetical protein